VRLGRQRHGSGRFLTTVLFVDIVGSTDLASAIGDAAWQSLLRRYYAAVRDLLKRFGGREIDTAGDGLFAAFDAPADAITCALAIRDAATPLGIQTRAGLHMGEAQTIEGKVGGIAVHIGARIAGAAGPGEVLVSGTVKDLVTGSRIRFEDRGETALKGIAEPWHLFLALPPLAESPTPSVQPGTAADRTGVRRWPAFLGSTRNRVVVIAAIGIVLVATTVTGWLASSTPPPSPPPTTVPPQSPAPISVLADSVGRMDDSGRIVATVRVGAEPDSLALGAGSAWATDTTDNTVTRLDASASTVIQRIPVGDSPAGIAFGFGAVWVANSGDRTVSRIDPTTNQVVAVIPVGTAPTGIATDDRWVWVTNRLDHTLSRIDPDDGSAETFNAGATPLGVATAAGSVWVADGDTSLVIQVDAQSGAVRAQVPVGNGPSAIAATPQGDAVWVVNGRDGTVARIDTTTARVTAAITVGADPTGIGISPDGVWVAVSSTSEIVKIDPTSDQIVGRFPVGASPWSLVVDSGGPLFTARAVEGSHRGGTLVVTGPASGFPTTIDPSYVEGFNLGLAILTNDALVTYKKAGGPDGLTLVPDLATSIPTSPDGGRTWTFQLRADVAYSNGQPVRPRDVLGSFERAAIAGNASGIGAGLAGNTDIVGASACTAKPPCDLSRGITFDDQAGTVTFHLVAADAAFPSTITGAFIVPAGTPMTESASPLPATGPYMVDRYEAGREARLVRNPDFHEWSSDAQPDGYPDVIDWTVSSLADPSSLVEQGLADVDLGSTPSAERLAQLRTREPAQLHVGPSQQTWFEEMNTRISPFNDLRVRQAINYAADRQAIVDAWGGPLTARITCQVIPPEFTGYAPYCPYTVDPNANGRWLGPDLEKAKALIDQAGVKGQRVTVWGIADGGQHAAVARYFTALLNQLGFKATTRLLDFGPFAAGTSASPDTVQMAGFWLLTDTRSGSDMIVGQFTCPDFPTPIQYGGQLAGLCSRPIDADVTKAEALAATDPIAANRLWAQIDRAIVDAAPAVMAFNPTDVTFVSQRVGNYQHHPQYLVVLDQLWVQ
jgi:YVTN family beta-propeller protein